MVERVLWQCPLCATRYRIPAGSNPEVCVACADAYPAMDVPVTPEPPPVPSIHQTFRRRRRERRSELVACIVAWILGMLTVAGIAWWILSRYNVEFKLIPRDAGDVMQLTRSH